MRFVIVAFVALLISMTSRADCFRHHLEEAIALNKERTELYANLTAGGSRKISEALISMEKEMLFFNRYVMDYDRQSKPYEEQGIGVACDSYVPMSLTPPFRAQDPRGPITGPDVDGRSVVSRWSLILALARGFDDFIVEGRRQLTEIQMQPRTNCLTAHFLESMIRIAALAPLHEAQAREAGLPSPQSIHRWMIRGHIFYLGESLRIDELAKPFQKQGVPILCQDLPPIEYDLEF